MGITHIEARAIRDNGWWVAFFEIDGREHGTQAKTLDKLEYMVKDAAALLSDKPITDFTVSITNMDEELVHLVEEYVTAANAEEQARKTLSATSRKAVNAMRERDLTMQDIGDLLGVTKGRVSQLVKA